MLSGPQQRLANTLLSTTPYKSEILAALQDLNDLNFPIYLQNPLRRIMPLHLVCQFHWDDVVRAFINKGATLLCTDHNGDTPLTYAQENNQQSIAQLLISREPKLPNHPNNLKETALHQAARRGKTAFLELYLGFRFKDVHQRCEVDPHDADRRTPLHFAASGGHIEAARVLLKYAANVEARTSGNKTPHEYALFERQMTLLKHPDVETRVNTPEYALFKRQTEVAALVKPSKIPSLRLLAAKAAFTHHPNLLEHVASCDENTEQHAEHIVCDVLYKTQQQILRQQRNQEEAQSAAKEVQHAVDSFCQASAVNALLKNLKFF